MNNFEKAHLLMSLLLKNCFTNAARMLPATEREEILRERTGGK
jgi:hypothetical protein